jgi:hypothetical protein
VFARFTQVVPLLYQRELVVLSKTIIPAGLIPATGIILFLLVEFIMGTSNPWVPDCNSSTAFGLGGALEGTLKMTTLPVCENPTMAHWSKHTMSKKCFIVLILSDAFKIEINN